MEKNVPFTTQDVPHESYMMTMIPSDGAFHWYGSSGDHVHERQGSRQQFQCENDEFRQEPREIKQGRQ